jgi:hypothetical protein
MPTAPANGQFGPNNFLVQTLSQRQNNQAGTIPAKFLQTASGDYVIDPRTSRPYVVPADYDPTAVVQKFQRMATTALENAPINADTDPFLHARVELYSSFAEMFPSGGVSDLQTAYDGIVNGEFVPDFTAAASFNFGLAAAAAGLSPTEAVAGGGIYNEYKSLKGVDVDTSGPMGNNPNNVPRTNDGFDEYYNGLFSSPNVSEDGVLIEGRSSAAGKTYTYTEALDGLRMDSSTTINDDNSIAHAY